jgi:hypothetical protein
LKTDNRKTAPDGYVLCGNCGKPIPPNTTVAVIPNGKNPVICHAEYSCSTAGNARYGYWGAGKLVSRFEEIEQC